MALTLGGILKPLSLWGLFVEPSGNEAKKHYATTRLEMNHAPEESIFDRECTPIDASQMRGYWYSRLFAVCIFFHQS